jgi:hypothetical protein
MQRVVGAGFFLMGLLLATIALHLREEKPSVDYGTLASCISEQRVRHELQDPHQELVNALYACGVYKLPVG